MIRVRENPYVGINPHLMSRLQTPGTGSTTALYPSFHSDHITHLKDFLNRVLPAAYLAVTEPSLQIQGRHTLESPLMPVGNPEPDVVVYRQTGAASGMPASQATATPTLHLPLLLEAQRQMMGISIYAVESAEHGVYGEPVTRLELLSPANMPGGSYDAAYQANRLTCLLAGTPLVEIDYLHEYPSPVSGLPVYPADPDARAFAITVTDPQAKEIAVYLFGVNEAIPAVAIPLTPPDEVVFDFSAPYAYTWETSRFGVYLDYQQEPVRMDRYSPADQAAIRQQMAVIAAQHPAK